MEDTVQWTYNGDADYPESIEDLQKVYTKWASTYDQDMMDIEDVSNPNMIKASFEFIMNEKATLMLDIGAGTGLTANYFKQAGFKGQIDAMDMNPAMLEICMKKGLYRKSILHTLSADNPFPVADGTYDVATSGGAFLVNNVPPECMRHVLKVLKSGGIFICNSRISKGNDEYLERLVKVADDLTKEGKGRMLSKEEVQYDDMNMSVVLVYRKL